MLANLLRWEDTSWWLLLDGGLKATLILALAALLSWLLRNGSAALRHRLWSIVFVALLILPIVSVALPGRTWRIIPRQWQAAVSTNEFIPTDQSTVVIRSTPPHELNSTTSPDEQVSPRDANEPSIVESRLTSDVSPERTFETVAPSPRTSATILGTRRAALSWLPLIWLAGALAVLLPLAIGIMGNWKLKLRGRSWVNAPWQQLLQTSSERLDLHRMVTLLVGSSEQMPMTFGWLRPCVVLPLGADQWSDDRQQMVLLHELAHVKRYDVAWQMVARVACALYWFHPLAWWALRQMRLDREHACDDCVLLAGQKASNYASQLLEIARSHQVHSPLASAALSMARRSQLEGRLLAVLDAHRPRAPLSARRAAALAISALLFVVGLGILRPALRVETRTSTAAELASEKTASNSKDASVASATSNGQSDQMLIAGTVLSPQGKPAAGATIELISLDQDSGWPIYRTQKQKIGYGSTKADHLGRFEAILSRPPPGKFDVVWVFATADGAAILQKRLKPRRTLTNVELKLVEPKTVRVQLIDSIGNPRVGIEPQLWHAESTDEFWLPDWEAREMITLWPQCTPCDAQGYTSVILPSTVTKVDFLVEDERFGSQIVGLKVTDEPMSIVLQPGLTISGKVIADDTGEPLEGAELVLMERPHRRVRTQADGSFRLLSTTMIRDSIRAPSEISLNVYPPQGSPYLFKKVERERPRDMGTKIEIPVTLRQGIAIDGTVTEKETGAPVVGAQLHFVQRSRRNNPFNLGDSDPSFGKTEMKYSTDADGRFRMPVWPGPGYLLVKAPSIDFLHVEVSKGEKWYGTPGLGREYHDGAVYLDYKPGDKPEPLTIALERGVTLERKVLRPNGQPAKALAYTRSYLGDDDEIGQIGTSLAVDDGLLRLPGFEPEHSNPIFIIDVDHHCGMTVSPTASETDVASLPIQLMPCGAAKFRFVTDKGEVLKGYEPRLHLVVTPGATATHRIEPNQPLWIDTIIWHNIAYRYPKKHPKTDVEGRIEIPDLIPGAKYALSYANKKGDWDLGYEFTVRSGETVDVGEIIIPEHE